MCEVFGKPLTEKFKQRGCVNGGFPMWQTALFFFCLSAIFVFCVLHKFWTKNGKWSTICGFDKICIHMSLYFDLFIYLFAVEVHVLVYRCAIIHIFPRNVSRSFPRSHYRNEKKHVLISLVPSNQKEYRLWMKMKGSLEYIFWMILM